MITMYRRMEGGRRIHAVNAGRAACGAQPPAEGKWGEPLDEPPDCRRCAERTPPRDPRWGYVRVSTARQSLGLDAQMHALREANVPDHQILQEVVSGRARDRPALNALHAHLRKGEVLYVARLDRLGRSVSDLSGLVHHWVECGVHVVGLLDGIDTRHASGRLALHVLAAAAQYEVELLSERTAAAMAVARARGVALGRRWALGPVEVEAVKGQLAEGSSVASLARAYRVSESTIRRVREGDYR